MGEIPPHYSMKPGERRVLGFDFTLALGAGETLTGPPTVVFDPATGVSQAGLEIAVVPTSVNILLVVADAAVNGADFNVLVTCPTSGAQIPKILAVIEVRAGLN